MAAVNSTSSDLYEVPLEALRKNTRTIISTLLNPIKVIPTENGLPRDWQGLAELVNISGEQLPYLQSEQDPTHEVLRYWCNTQPNNSTIKRLLEFLEILDRFDVIDDISLLIEEDIVWYKQKSQALATTKPPDLEADNLILTSNDVLRINQGLDLLNYDAFILFADEDQHIAIQVTQIMEKNYGLRFCFKDRDLIGGSFEHQAIIQLISQRCNRLIVIVSDAFLCSPENKFFYSFAQAIGIREGKRKIIPCIFKPCKLPIEWSYYFTLDYNRSCKLWNFWDKLNESVQTPALKEITNQPQVNSAVSSTSKENVITEIDDNSLIPVQEIVKCNSTGNLNTVSTVSEAKSNSSTSLIIEEKKSTTKNLLVRFFSNNKSEKTSAISDKNKKRFWPIKRKAAVAN